MDAFARGADGSPEAGESSGRRGPSLATLGAATTVLTFLVVLLGVWTAVAGYGLTCDGRWPLCDGVLGLFPADFGSFVEWFHRLVAMLAGFAILGTAGTAWARGADARTRRVFGTALLLTPLQIVLGGLTVTQYEQAILVAHFGTALAILTLLVVGTLRTARTAPTVVEACGLAAAVLVGAMALAPGVVVAGHSPGMHVGYQGLALLGYVSLLATAVGPHVRYRALRWLAGGGAALVAVGSVVGRVRVDPAARLVVLGCLLGAVVVALAAGWLAHTDVLEPDRIGPAEF